MKRIIVGFLSATTCLIAACSQQTDSNASTTNANSASVNASDTTTPAAENMAAPATSGAQAFVNGAAASDAFEIASSRLAADNASSSAIKTFAGQMIAAHTESTAKLKSVAGALSPSTTPDPALDSDQQAKLDALKAKKGKEFDQEYVADQLAAHQATLTKLQDYAANGDVPELKQFAAGLTPKVAAHLNMAKSLKS